jgi:hypothetical protein
MENGNKEVTAMFRTHEVLAAKAADSRINPESHLRAVKAGGTG